MGGTDSKIDNSEPLYESIDDRNLIIEMNWRMN